MCQFISELRLSSLLKVKRSPWPSFKALSKALHRLQIIREPLTSLLVEMALIFQKLRSRVDLQFAIVLMSEYRNMNEVCSYHLGPKLRTFQMGVFLR
jgi:hypothetical protein